MNRNSVVVWCAALLVLASWAPAARAELIIDDFRLPSPESVAVITGTSPDPTFVQTPDPGVLGGERDLLIDVIGVPSFVSYSGSIGEGLFEFGSVGDPGTVAVLQYDGLDAEGGNSPINSEGLGGVDLTAYGSQFQLDFLSVDSGNSTVIDIAMEVHGPAGVATFAGTIPDTPGAVTHVIPFASFTGADVFAQVTSIALTMNSSATPDVDFSLDTVSVPEPSTCLILGVGGLAVLLRRRRRTV